MSNTAFAQFSAMHLVGVSLTVMQTIVKGSSRHAVLTRNGKQVGEIFTADSTDEVRELAAQFYIDRFITKTHDQRRQPKIWLVHPETGTRKLLNRNDVDGVEALKSMGYVEGRDVAPKGPRLKKDPEADHGLKHRHWFHKDTHKVRLHSHEVAQYMEDGYIPGRGPNNKYDQPVGPVVDPCGQQFNA